MMFNIIKDFKDFRKYKKLKMEEASRLADLVRDDRWIFVCHVSCICKRFYDHRYTVKLTVEINPFKKRLRVMDYTEDEPTEHNVKQMYYHLAHADEVVRIDAALKKYGVNL